MRRFLMMLMVCSLALAASARAEVVCTDPDLLAIVFDNGDINLTPNTGTPFNMYVVLLNPSHENLDAFEFKLVMPNTSGTLFVLQEFLPPGAINIGMTDGLNREYIVGLPTPQPTVNRRVSLVSFSMMSLTNTANQNFFVQPTAIQSIHGKIAYNVTSNGNATLVPMTPISQSFALSVARLFPQTPLSYCTGGSDLSDLRIDVATNAGALRDPLARAGTATGATDGFDATLESPEPAPPPGNYLCTSFEHTTWPLGPRFGSDIRATFDATLFSRTWPLMVETDQNGPVTLTFTPSFTADDDIGCQLRDLQTGQIYSLFPQLSYTYQNFGMPTTRRFELIVGHLVPPAVNPILRSILAGWSLVSLPLTPPAGANTIGATMINQAPGYAWVYTYGPDTGYQAAAATNLATVGTGYWLGSTSPFSWGLNGTRNLNGVTMPLTPGWNLVGNPIWFSGPISGLRVFHGGNTYNWLAAVQAGLVSPDLQSYNTATGAYFDATLLVPWQSYWVNALAGDVSLYAYWPNFQQVAGAAEPQAVPPVAIDAWRTDLALVDAQGNVRTVTIGVDPSATSGFDALYDRPQPPASPQGGPSLCVLHPEWQLAAGNGFTRDVVGPGDDALSWTLTFSAPIAGTATLDWDATGWPAGLDFQIYLPGENRVAVMSMRAQPSVPLDVGPQPRSVIVRAPDLTSGIGDLPAAGLYELSVHPNPFNPRATMTFSLPTPGNAEIRIYSVRGELVGVLGGHAYAAGRHEETWNGVDRQGRDVPSGSYFGRMYVDGGVEGGIIRMSLVR